MGLVEHVATISKVANSLAILLHWITCDLNRPKCRILKLLRDTEFALHFDSETWGLVVYELHIPFTSF